MISVDEALTILRDNVASPRQVELPLAQAFSCRLAEDIWAPESSPRYTNSAMDGFALRWQDLGEEHSATLRLVGESQAGIPYGSVLQAGESIRISTGAMVPEGADTVVRMEDCREDEGSVSVLKCKKEGQDVRCCGEEFRVGDLLLHKGEELGARQLALLTAVGVETVQLYAPPEVSLLITGTELARESSPAEYQIRDSNTPMLKGAVLEAGGKVSHTEQVEDSLEATISAIKIAQESGVDIILCSGGVSVGRHDHVKEAALAVGFEQLFWQICQKPGKPLFVAKHGKTMLFGLPGNPVSAYMCFQNFVAPTLAHLQGARHLRKRTMAKALEAKNNKGKRTTFYRVKVESREGDLARFSFLEKQGSHMLTTIVEADGYIAMEPQSSIASGDLCEIVLF